MCGLAGLWTTRGLNEEQLYEAVRRMAGTLEHRGPDDAGAWADPQAGVGYGFRRLAILDVSEAGHQPMQSSSGRYIVVFNGEVYNYRELRRELEQKGSRFRGNSDTEVILAAFESWGVADAVRRFVGMFAISVWDREQRSLSLIRDRLGIKPLFVYSCAGVVMFGSELKALVAGPGFDRSLDMDALVDFLRHLYVPGPRTIFTYVSKLPPGHILTVTDPASPLPPAQPYWSLSDVSSRGLDRPFAGSEIEAADELERLLSDSVQLRLRSDVPLGALLSGGIDSSIVVAMMQSKLERPLKTFSIAFTEARFNEAPHAARVAEYLGTDHTELTLTGDDALAVVPDLANFFDEPFADTSNLPAYLICRLARKDVTVAVSGDGGDEVFGGYNRYAYGDGMMRRLHSLPGPARRLLKVALRNIPVAGWNAGFRWIRRDVSTKAAPRISAERLHKISLLLEHDTLPLMYRSLVSVWPNADELVVQEGCSSGRIEQVLGQLNFPRWLDRIMLTDQQTYMVDDQLAKVDRVSMAASLELRVPLLDHRVVEFAWTVPPAFKIRNGEGKWLLRQVLYRRVPRDIVERPKMGLSVPIADWLRGPLRPWAEDLLAPERIQREGFLHPTPIRAAWQGLQQGHDHHALGLWAVLMFEAWKDRWHS